MIANSDCAFALGVGEALLQTGYVFEATRLGVCRGNSPRDQARLGGVAIRAEKLLLGWCCANRAVHEAPVRLVVVLAHSRCYSLTDRRRSQPKNTPQNASTPECHR